ncbi:ATP-binding protein [Brevundimonas fontaquae]|uniref:histidine kinase n=1 Tax=Brevundimonas fontaquae TaxID=2813778 RepID=A0ABX7LPJ9_9CAUL|nr:ATP-binding protein [Brevundimonas fontaquae]QSF54770.1 response regulator [Brevundimonas fontaquae]
MNQGDLSRLGGAMAARARQWRTRIGLGAVIAVAFFTMTGWLFALGWLLVYSILQALEFWGFRASRKSEDWTPSTVWAWWAVGFIALNNLVFGAFAVRQAVGGEDLSVIVAILVMAGAIVNGVIACAGSRHLTWASILPHIGCFCAVTASVLMAGHPPWLTAQMGVAGLLFVVLASVASRQLAQKLQVMEEGRLTAESANVSKSQFLANMSHEIRTPLNGVVSMAHLLARSPLSAPDRELVQIIQSSADTLTTLLSDILDMARIEAGEVTLEYVPYHFGDMVRSACALFTLRAQEKGVAMVLELPEDADRFVSGDGNRLRQVLNNLISNAVKFTTRGQVTVIVTLPEAGCVRVVVADTGVGFDPQACGDLFARFQQADGTITRKFGGSGLGLAISHELVCLMDGRIGYDSVAGEGSTFWVDLPFEPCAPSGVIVLDGDEIGIDRPLAVLVADDHPINLKVATMILEQTGSRCTTAVDGAEAVAAFQSGRFDLVLMDMQMPVMDGLTAVREIRALEERSGLARTPIAILSANAMPEHIAAASDAGADEHLSKPVRPADLIRLVSRLTV